MRVLKLPLRRMAYFVVWAGALHALCAAGFVGEACAAPPDPPAAAAPAPSELALFEKVPMPVVYSASRMEEPIIQAPAAISVISAKNLEQEGIIDLPNAFRYVPGVDVMAIDGGRWGVSARGYNELWSRRMLVLIDGMSVYTPLFSGVRWEMLPLLVDDVKQIEIVRGPNDTLYGFNAFNGVININTWDPKETKGFFGKYVYGNYGVEQFIGRYGDTIDLRSMGKIDFRVGFSSDTAQGYGDDYGQDFSDKRDLDTVTARARYTVSDAFNVEALFGLKDGLHNEGPNTAAGATYAGYSMFDFEQVRLNGIFSDTHSAYVQLYRWKFNRDAKTLVGAQSNNDVEEIEYDVEFQDTFSLFDGKSSTVWGASYRRNEADSWQAKADFDAIQKGHVTDDLWSAFFNERAILVSDLPYVKQLTAVAGVRAEWSHLTCRTDFAPRASLLYSPVVNTTFRTTYARGYRLPSFVEEFDTGFVPFPTGSILRVNGNQGLKSEIVDSYEAGYSGIYAEGKLELNADLYWAYYRNMIGLDRERAFPLPVPYDFNNSGSSKSRGVELSAVTHPFTWFDLYTNYTYETITDYRIARNDMQFTGGVPMNKINGGVNVAFKKDSIERMPYLDGWSTNLNLCYRSGYTFFNNSDAPRSEFAIKPHVRFDMRVAKSFFDEGLEVAFIGNNMMGPGNYEARWVQVPQEYYMTVTMRGWPWEFGKKTGKK